MAMRRALLVLMMASLAAAAGCRPKDFDDLEARAPIRVYEAPEEFDITTWQELTASGLTCAPGAYGERFPCAPPGSKMGDVLCRSRPSGSP